MFNIHRYKIPIIITIILAILFIMRGTISYQICLLSQERSNLDFIDKGYWDDRPFEIWYNSSSKNLMHLAKNEYGTWYIVNKEASIGLIEFVGEYEKNSTNIPLYKSEYYYYVDKRNLLPEEVLEFLPKGVSCELITYNTFTVVHLISFQDPNDTFEFDPLKL